MLTQKTAWVWETLDTPLSYFACRINILRKEVDHFLAGWCTNWWTESDFSLSFFDFKPFKVQWRQMVTFRSVWCHPGLTYIINFWHSGKLKMSSYTGIAKCKQLTPLPFKGLNILCHVAMLYSVTVWVTFVADLQCQRIIFYCLEMCHCWFDKTSLHSCSCLLLQCCCLISECCCCSWWTVQLFCNLIVIICLQIIACDIKCPPLTTADVQAAFRSKQLWYFVRRC